MSEDSACGENLQAMLKNKLLQEETYPGGTWVRAQDIRVQNENFGRREKVIDAMQVLEKSRTIAPPTGYFENINDYGQVFILIDGKHRTLAERNVWRGDVHVRPIDDESIIKRHRENRIKLYKLSEIDFFYPGGRLYRPGT